MKKVLIFCAVVLMLFAVSGLGQAATYNYTVTPDQLAGASFANGQGGLKFGYDSGPGNAGVPVGSTTSGGAPGYGDSAFYSDVQGSTAGGRDYSALRLSPKDIFGVSNVTLNDLTSLSYYTKWDSGIDWQLKIYTEPGATGWYGNRFNFVRPSPNDNDWHQYSTDSLNVSDIRNGATGSYSYPTSLLSSLNGTYGTENILFIDIISSYMTASPASYSYLDGVQMTLASNDTAKINLAVVPEPISSTLFLVGAATLGFRRFRKNI